MARGGLARRIGPRLAQWLWPYVEPHAKDALLGPQIKLLSQSAHAIDATQPTCAWLRIVETTEGDGYPIKVGPYSALNENAYAFLGGMHDISLVSLFHYHRVMGVPGEPEPVLTKGPIVVGSDVWLAFESVLMSGVTIGHGAIVAARAVVTRDVEPYEIVGGVPARHISWRFDEPTREALLRIRWWDWPLDTILERLAELQSPDVAAFIKRYDPGVV